MHGLAVMSMTLLAIVAGMFLLAKAKKEELGAFFKIVSYTVVLAGFACLICCIIHCCCAMGCKDGACMRKEVRVMEMRHGGMHHGCMKGGMDDCNMKGGDMKCCAKHKGEMHHSEMEKDSISK